MAKNTVKRVTYLHGDLDLTIVEARHLPNMDIVFDCFRRCFTTCDTRVQHLCKDPKTDSTTGDAAAPATAIENKMRRLGYPCRSQKKRSATLALRDLLGSDTSGVAQGGASSELDLRNISKLILPLLGASNYNQTPIQLNGWIVSPMDSRYRRYSLTLHEKHS
ncbi:hypothetical protein ACFX1Q_007721 [Malus domestica]